MAVHFKKKDGTTYQHLTAEQRLFVVRALAHFNGDTEVVRMVAKEFGVSVTKQAVRLYDPTRTCGASLSTPLKKYFYDQRKRFVNGIQRRPLSQRSVQLDRLEREYEEARDEKDRKAVIKIIAEAAKIMRPMDRVGGDDEERDDD